MKSKLHRTKHSQREFSAEEHLAVQQQIERLAHALWRARDGQSGSELEDWLRAEHEVIAEFLSDSAKLIRPARTKP